MRWLLGTAAILAGVALATTGLTLVLARAARGRPALAALVRSTRFPLVVVASASALRARMVDVSLDGTARALLEDASGLATIVAVAWLVASALRVLEGALAGRFDVSVRDNRRARARRTQLVVIRRVTTIVVIVVAVVVALQLFDWGRELGTSLLAASGIIGIVIGVAGRSTIGNLIAGMQIAFAEPIRLDDVVVVEGEWGRIEEITLTQVVVRIWDERRLVLPTSYFVEQPFQNWTRHASDVHGTIELWVDHAADVQALRVFFHHVVAQSGLWDGRSAVLQVTEATPHALKVRGLVSAGDANALWDLRCELREALARWIAESEAGAPWLRVHAGDRVDATLGGAR